MKIVKTTSGSYVEVTDDLALNKIPKELIKDIFTQIPEEAKLTEKELSLIKYIDNKLLHLEDKVLKHTGEVTVAKCYKQWKCIEKSFIREDALEKIRHTSIEYNVDKEADVTAILIVDLDNKKFYVELRQSGLTLPYCYEVTNDLEYAIICLQDYIYNSEDYADYK